MVAGGEMRHAADATFEMTGDFTSHAVRVDWVKNFLYPSQRTFQFSELVTSEAGYVIGIDSNGRNKQNRDTNPPGHAMSGLRFTATQRELWRASPALLLEMRNHPDKVSASPAIAIGSVSAHTESWPLRPSLCSIADAPASAYPHTLDYDNVRAIRRPDVCRLAQLVASRPPRPNYELNGEVVAGQDHGIAQCAAINHFGFPPLQGTAPKPATVMCPISGCCAAFIGTYLDSDNPSFDTRATDGLKLVEVAPGVQHAVGGSHNSLIVELGDALVVFDAPVSDWQSNWTIAAAQAKYPGKPIKYLVLTHHHMDHVGGLRAYAAAGATRGWQRRRRALPQGASVPFTHNPISPRDTGQNSHVSRRSIQIPDGKRQVTVYLAENPHANGMLIGYIADAQVGFVTDIWSPGAAPLPDKINPALAAVVNTVKKAGITPLKFAGGHGATGDYAPLAALAGN
jgi:glyoxylase-like metal-dependent hydrolase (beta-lactamase superfamily II)